MLIEGEDKTIFELKIVNYQFPEITYDYDGNWLLIVFCIKNELGEWKTTSPCLLTWEVKSLINWFRNLANNIKPVSEEECFLELNVSFLLVNNYDDNLKQIKVVLDLEQFFDKEFQPQPINDDLDFQMTFLADNKELTDLQMNYKVNIINFRRGEFY